MNDLLDPAFLRRLESLTLRARRLYAGHQTGARRTPRRGAGLEFADHRAYAAGDDLRRLDWPLLARLERPYIKLYEQEQDLPVHLLLDTSRSMAFGAPSKLSAAARLAAALAHIALAGLDRVGAALFDGRGLRLQAPARGQGALFSVLRFLSGGVADGPGGTVEALRLHAAAARPGMTIVLSDFLDPDFEQSLRPHIHRRHELIFVQVLAPEEIDPQWEGDFELVDAETGEQVELTLGPRELAAYRERFAVHQAGLQDFARRYGAEFFSLTSNLPLEDALRTLQRGRFLSGRS